MWEKFPDRRTETETHSGGLQETCRYSGELRVCADGAAEAEGQEELFGVGAARVQERVHAGRVAAGVGLQRRWRLPGEQLAPLDSAGLAAHSVHVGRVRSPEKCTTSAESTSSQNIFKKSAHSPAKSQATAQHSQNMLNVCQIMRQKCKRSLFANLRTANLSGRICCLVWSTIRAASQVSSPKSDLRDIFAKVTINLFVNHKWRFANNGSLCDIKYINNSAQLDSSHFCINDGKWLAGLSGSQQKGNRGKRGIARVFIPIDFGAIFTLKFVKSKIYCWQKTIPAIFKTPLRKILRPRSSIISTDDSGNSGVGVLNSTRSDIIT